MKLIKSSLFLIAMILFSCYYTNLTASLIKEYDPIMIKIKEKQALLETKTVNSIVKDNRVILGISNQKINIKKSYEKMKNVNTYSSNLLVFDEVLLKNDFNNYITNKLTNKHQLSFLFIPKNLEEIEFLENLAKTKNINLNIFLSKDLVIKNYDYLKNLNKIISINSYDYTDFTETQSLINKINDDSFCLLKDENSFLKNICKSNKKHTILPLIIDNNIYKNIKNNLNNTLFLIDPIKEDELIISINYLISHGYEIIKLKNLLEL